MDINDNQQINTFLKGMNTDVSDALIDSSQYRYAENLRLVTNVDSNEGELRIIEGTGHGYDYIHNLPGTILALTSIRNLLIAIVKTSYVEYEESFPGISVYTNTDKGDGEWFCVVNNIPYDEFVQEGEIEPHFSLVTRWESENNIKLYIAEGVKSIICLNVTKQYPHIGRTHNTMKDIAPYIETALPSAQVILSTGGLLKSAKVLYTYRYYNIGLPASLLAPLSRVVSLYKGYNQGYEPELKTNRATDVTIPTISDNVFTKLLIFRINYVVLGLDPTVNLIYDGDVVGSIKDTGQSVELYGVSEFLGLTLSLIIPKVIESKEDYLFAANIKYTQDDYDKDLEDLNFRSYSSGDFQDGWNSNYQSALDYNKLYNTPNQDFNINNWKRPYSEHDNSQYGGGIGPIVSWFYTTKQYYVDKDNTFYTLNGSKTINPVVSLRRGEVYRYGIIIYNSKGVKSSVNWIADIMVPDKPFSEYSDVDFKGSYLTGGLASFPRFDGAPLGPDKWIVSVIGIEFVVDSTQIPDCSGFEIVRCQKTYDDSKVLTQGIIGITDNILKLSRWDDTVPVYSDTSYLMPQGFLTALFMSDENNEFKTISPNRRYLLFASPEHAYQPDDMEDLLNMYSESSFIETQQSYKTLTTTAASVAPGRIEYRQGTSEDYIYDNFVIFMGLPSQNIDNSHNLIMQYDASYDNGTPVTSRDVFGFGAILKEYCGWGDSGATAMNINSRGNLCWETSVTNIPACYIINDNNVVKQKLTIKDVAYPNIPKPTHFFSTDKVGVFRDDVTPIEGALYVEWMAHGIFSQLSLTADEDVYDDFVRYSSPKDFNGTGTGSISGEHGNMFKAGYTLPIGIPGRSILFKVDADYNDNFSSDLYAPVTVANICKNTIPYGGPLTYKSATVDYLAQGLYVLVDGQHIDSVIIYDGDCYPGIFEYTSLHVFNNSVFKWANRAMINYYVPIESNIDLRATYGDLYSRSSDLKSYCIQPLAGAMDGFSQTKDQYLYNTAYNTTPNIISYSQTIYEDIDTNNFDVRIHNSQRKTNNEHIDKWTEFKATDYIDVDSRFGEITNIRLFKDKLIYWQANATGIISSNERVVLNDLENNNIILGTGGIMQRFDYISTIYGMKKNQYEAEIQSNTSQYWWDEKRKEILLYNSGLLLIPLTKVKYVRNYINKNTPTSHPALVYNNKHDEIICSIENNESIIYNEKILAFTSVYKMMPLFRSVINNTTIIANSSKLYHMDVVRDEISLLGVDVYPKLKYVVNKQNTYTKVFDISTFGGRFYGGGSTENGGPNQLTFTFDTPLKQHSTGTGNDIITNREYDFRLDIPRNNNDTYGGRMRGKFMQCELKSSSNSGDFSLQYITTKYRMSWS